MRIAHLVASTAMLALGAPASDLRAQQTPADQVALRYAAFDPLAGEPSVPADLQAGASSRLHLVQLATELRDEHRRALRALGARLHHHVPHRAWLVRMDREVAGAVADLPWVRWVGAYHPAYRLEPELVAELAAGTPVPPRRYDILMVAQHEDEAAITGAIAELGGHLHLPPRGSILVEATLSRAQLLALARRDETLWIDRWTAPGEDMNNARIQGGANFIEAAGGHTGKGVRGHSLEGVYPEHPELAANAYRSAPIPVHDPTPSLHGSSTFGIVFAAGVNPQARGMLPDGQGLYTHYTYVLGTTNRYSLVGELVDPNQPYQAMFQTASWGYARTTQYTSRTAEMDLIIFDHDLPITQSNGNSGMSPQSRPVSFAKNILSIGGFLHYDNADPTDDCWCNTGSTGPASDGRIKPELSAFFDQVFTSGGPQGYGEFGGTSASCPMVAGHVGLAIELFTDGLLGYPAAPSWQVRFPYRPHYSTSKALIVNTARQHFFVGTNHDMTRMHQGWGMPSVEDLYVKRDSMLVIDELDVLEQGERRTYWVLVPPGTPEFRATMTHAEPPANPASSIHRINSLDLRVTAPSGATYWGNNGLIANMFSTPGGEPNDLDTLENVWLDQPAAGVYAVEVRATAVRQDAHVETPAIDADYALVVSGLAGLRDRSGLELDLGSTAPGDFTVTLQKLPPTWAGGLTLLSAATSRVASTGQIFGLEADALTLAIAGLPAAEGNVFSFLPSGNPGSYPNAPFRFPAAVAQVLSGFTFDGVAVVYDAQGAIVAVSNVSRVTVR